MQGNSFCNIDSYWWKPVNGTSTSWWRNPALRDGTEPVWCPCPKLLSNMTYLLARLLSEVLVSARASFWLDKKIRKLECFHEDLVPPANYFRTSKNNLLLARTIHVLIALRIEEELFMGTQQRCINDGLRWDIPYGVPVEATEELSKALSHARRQSSFVRSFLHLFIY